MKQFLNKIKDYVVNHPKLVFIALLLCLSVNYNYPEILFKRPQSVHRWRQSDCASMALNYYQSGMRFFHPQTHNLTSDNSKSSYTATSEIPILYYSIAILYKIFGYHDCIYRLVNTLIFFLGLFYLFKTLLLLKNNLFWSASITLLFFTSPILVFYGNNYLTDSSAFSFCLIAWFHFIKYYLFNSSKNFNLSMLFFLIAGSLKLFLLLTFVALFFIFLIELTGIKYFGREDKLFKEPKKQWIPFVLISIIIGSWAAYAHHYNSIHQSEYFSTSVRTFSLWHLEKSTIHSIIEKIKIIWLNQFFHVFTLYFFAVIFVVTIIFIKKTDKFLFNINLLTFLGSIVYIIIFFMIFKDHDCYTINMFFLLIFTFFNFIYIIKHHFPSVYNSFLIKVIFASFLIFNIVHANKQMNIRYNGWWTDHPKYEDYDVIAPYLRSIGIEELDTVICLPDFSHTTLYLMNQRGWTHCFGYNRDSSGIASSIKNGAKYIILNGEEILNEEFIKPFIKNQIGEFNQVKIFKVTQ